jgi:hypothetical protein
VRVFRVRDDGDETLERGCERQRKRSRAASHTCGAFPPWVVQTVPPRMAAPRQGRPVREEWARHRGAAFAAATR